MGARRNFVDEQSSVAGLEQFDRHDADIVEGLEQSLADFSCFVGQPFRGVRRSQGRAQNVIAVNIFDQVVTDDFARLPPRRYDR